MALIEYKCSRCGEGQLVFSGEEGARLRIRGSCGVATRWCHTFVAMPPSPSVVHCTNTYMSDPQLDSLKTMYELDRQLNIEAAEERELKAYNQIRISV